MTPICRTIDAFLLRGFYNQLKQSVCMELVEHWERLWTFVVVEGVEPTNNAAERALRQTGIWRKLSFGTQSADCSRFVERMLTVNETKKRQDTYVFAWLTQPSKHLHGRPAPAFYSIFKITLRSWFRAALKCTSKIILCPAT